jgi:hypothetical protein
MHEPSSVPAETERLQGHAERAFVEVQRADTKATALCGIAGGLLAAGVAVLSSTHAMPLIGMFPLVLMRLLLMASIGAALLALRPWFRGWDTCRIGGRGGSKPPDRCPVCQSGLRRGAISSV